VNAELDNARAIQMWNSTLRKVFEVRAPAGAGSDLPHCCTTARYQKSSSKKFTLGRSLSVEVRSKIVDED